MTVAFTWKPFSRSGLACGLFATAALLLDTSHANAVIQYTIVPLGTLGGTTASAFGINALGQVTGTSTVTGNASSPAFMWTNGTMVSIGTLGGANATGYGINDAGQVAGFSDAPSASLSRAFRYSGGVMSDIGTLGGVNSQSLGINGSGMMTGTATTAGEASYKAFEFNGISMSAINTGLNTDSVGYGINDAGISTGTYYLGPSNYRAYTYQSGTLTSLGTMDGGSGASGRGINAAAHVAGWSYRFGFQDYHAFLHDGVVMTDLGTLGGAYSEALALNNADMVVGNSTLLNGSERAFLWDDGQMYDLASLVAPSDPLSGVVTLTMATSINDSGMIVANGTNATGQASAFLLVPVATPEPASLALLCGGLLALASARRTCRPGLS